MSVDGKPERRIQRIFEGTLELPHKELLCQTARGPHKSLTDVTIFIDSEKFMEACRKRMSEDKSLKGLPYLCTVDLSGDVSLEGGDPTRCRLHAALCYGGKYYAVTMRDPPAPAGTSNMSFQPSQRARLKASIGDGEWKTLRSLLRFDSLDPKKFQPSPRYPTTKYEVADIAYKEIFRDPSESAGLVLITGGTGSGKTQVMNGLLARHLKSLFEKRGFGERPRVVAVGDPVETSFFDMKQKNRSGANQAAARSYFRRPIDFVPRTLGTDVESVDEALRDALRETTAAYVVSELRDPKDFKATLRFAATGQIIFATAHNTSLVDTIRKLMSLSSTPDTPNSRSLLAQRLKAVIHLRTIFTKDGSGQATLPSIWINNPSGVRNFVSDGLASLLPHGRYKEGAETPGVLGLAWAAQTLFGDTNTDEAKTYIIEQAHRNDLLIR